MFQKTGGLVDGDPVGIKLELLWVYAICVTILLDRVSIDEYVRSIDLYGVQYSGGPRVGPHAPEAITLILAKDRRRWLILGVL